VALFVRKEVAFRTRRYLGTDACEAVWIELLDRQGQGALLCSCYVPPNEHEQLDALSAQVGAARALSSRALVVGDLKARSYAMGDDVENSSMANALSDLLNGECLVIHNVYGVKTRKDPSGRESILDFTLSTPALSQSVQNWRTCAEFKSDHVGVLFEVCGGSQFGGYQRSRGGWKLNRADWETFHEALSLPCEQWTRASRDTEDLEQLLTSWSTMVLAVAERVVQRKGARDRCKRWSDNVKQAVLNMRRKRKL